MAQITITLTKTLPTSSDKSDFHELVSTATASLAAGSITASDILNGTVTAAKLAGAISDSLLSPITTAGKVNVSSITGTLPVTNGGTGATAAANAASGVVVLNASSQLPAVSGALLTNLPIKIGTPDWANKSANLNAAQAYQAAADGWLYLYTGGVVGGSATYSLIYIGTANDVYSSATNRIATIGLGMSGAEPGANIAGYLYTVVPVRNGQYYAFVAGSERYFVPNVA
jgi:hypothetical protein